MLKMTPREVVLTKSTLDINSFIHTIFIYDLWEKHMKQVGIHQKSNNRRSQSNIFRHILEKYLCKGKLFFSVKQAEEEIIDVILIHDNLDISHVLCTFAKLRFDVLSLLFFHVNQVITLKLGVIVYHKVVINERQCLI